MTDERKCGVVCNCDSDQYANDTDYVNEGMLNWLNNKPKQAEVFLKKRIHRTSVLAAYSFVLCMVRTRTKVRPNDENHFRRIR